MTPVALITASSAGLGAAAAKKLAALGYAVALNYNSNQQKAEQVISDILESNPSTNTGSNQQTDSKQCIAIQADMSQRTEIKRLVQETIDHYGRLDFVMSNQGWTQIRDFNDLDDNMEESDWDTCFNFNVKSHLFLFHATRPYLAESKGSFVTVASLAGVIPSGSSIPYAVTKAAQIHLVKSLAKVAAPDIAVNSISPGIMLTEWGRKFPESKLEAATQRSALKRLAAIDDVVQQIALFATSRSVTGQNAVIDAGWSLG